MESGGQEENDQARNKKNGQNDGDVAPQVKIQVLQIGLDENGARMAAFNGEAMEDHERITGKAVAVLLGQGRHKLFRVPIARISGERLALAVIDTRADNVRIGAQGGEKFPGRLRVIEQKRGVRVVIDDICEADQSLDHGPALRHHFVTGKSGAGQRQRDHAEEHDYPHQLVSDRQVSKLAHATGFRRQPTAG